jgi:hypothetical protein
MKLEIALMLEQNIVHVIWPRAVIAFYVLNCAGKVFVTALIGKESAFIKNISGMETRQREKEKVFYAT